MGSLQGKPVSLRKPVSLSVGDQGLQPIRELHPQTAHVEIPVDLLHSLLQALVQVARSLLPRIEDTTLASHLKPKPTHPAPDTFKVEFALPVWAQCYTELINIEIGGAGGRWAQ